MINCKKCGASRDIYAGRCLYCGAQYEASGGSETTENLSHEIIESRRISYPMNGVMAPNEFRKAIKLEKFNSDFNEMKTLQAVENAIDSLLVF